MSKIIWIIVFFVIGGYAVSTYLEKEALKERKLVEAKELEDTIRSSVKSITNNHDAIDRWETSLSNGESYRSEPILTIELEKLWLQGKPILFIGSIQDIATHNNDHYSVSLRRGKFGSFENMLTTELRLSLISDKVKVDLLLENHPELFTSFGFNNSVAVVAIVETLKTIYMQGDDGASDEVRIGEGILLDIVYIGNVRI